MKMPGCACDLASPPASSPARAADAYETFRATKFFSSLDGLRALSILAVVWHHTAASAVSERWPLLHQGNHGVTLFFVISAFLITTLLLRAKERGTLDVPRFWARRALRILPLYYAVLGVYVMTVFAFEKDGGARAAFFTNLPAFASFTSNWFVNLHEERVIFYFAWSLAAEEQFYVCWPWVERFFSRAGAVVVAVAALVVTQGIAWLYTTGSATHFVYKVISSVPPAILLGVLVAHLLHERRLFVWLYAFLGRRSSAWLAAALALATVSAAPAFGPAGNLAVSLSFGVLVLCCVVREDNGLAKAMRLRPLAWIGTVSFGIYLMHMLTVNVVRRASRALFDESWPLLEFVSAATLSIIVATISYRTFEAYFLRRKERWFGDRPTVLPAESPARVATVRPG